MRGLRNMDRDARAMALGLGPIEKEIAHLESKQGKGHNTDKSTKKRLERLYFARKQLIENPEDAKGLLEKINDKT